MVVDKKQLIGGINSDDSERLLERGDYLNMENLRVGGSGTGRDGRIENIPGTKLMYENPVLFGKNTELGKCKDDSRRRIFYFNHSQGGDHNILCWDEIANVGYIVMKSDAVEGGLNFSLDYPIDAFFINGALYFTDNLNNPRKISVERAIKLFQPDYVTTQTPYGMPVKQVNITWIRKPPILPPSFIKQTINVSDAGSGTGYRITAKWYGLGFSAGPSMGANFGGFILRVTTPLGDTYYGGPTRQINGSTYRFDLYENNGTISIPPNPLDPNPALPLSIDFATLPGATSFGTVEELMEFYSNGPDHPLQYPHQIKSYGEVTGPVQITNFPVPNTLNPNNFIRYDAFQFCWRYIYWDYEESVLSALSKTANYNYKTDTFDTIRVTLPLDEFIEQDVLRVELVVRYVANTEDNHFVIKKWTNTPGDEGALIMDHNNKIKALEFLFDNSFTGEALDKAYATKKSDTFPLLAKSCDAAKNRSYLANYLAGYDAPKFTTLTAAIRQSTIGEFKAQWVFIFYNDGNSKAYFIQTDSGFYSTSFAGPAPPYPTTINFGALLKVANDTASFATYINSNPLYPNLVANIQFTQQFVTVTGAPTSFNSDLTNTRVLKTDAAYKLALHFKDFAGREFGVVTADTLLLHTTDRNFGQTTFQTGFDWSLISGNIPAEATHYSVDVSLCLRTRYFLSMRSKKARYVGKDDDGKNNFTHSGYANDLKGCAFDITVLLQYGFGYAFDGGSNDNVKIWRLVGDVSSEFQLKVTGTDGNWLLTELQDLGNLDDDFVFLFEIYTPHKRTETESFWEVSQIFPILNPGQPNRDYSVKAGFIEGDVHLLPRVDDSGSYLVEAMSPNDNFYKNWNTDAGKPAFIDKIGQVRLKDGICFSNKLIPESRVNGLSTYEPLNADTVFESDGEIQKIIVADKQKADGNVLLAVCSNGITSIYLGETQLQANEGEQFVAQSVGVIGTKNSLQGGFGTLHPGTVFEYLGQIWGMDVYNGCFWRYANNGVFPVSNYKMKRFFARWCKKYLEDGTNVIKQRNGFYNIVAGVDPYNGEVLVSLPATEDPGFSGDLPGYDNIPSYTESIANRYDCYDGKAKTICFKFKSDQNRWVNNYGWVAEGIDFIGMNCYAFKNGNIYKLEGDPVNFNTFFGTKYPGRICFSNNVGPSDVKLPLTVMLEASDKPNFTHLYSPYPNIQATDLVADNYVKDEGIFYAAFMNDRLSPNVDGSPAKKMMKGDRIRSATPYAMLEFAIYDKLVNIDFINVGYRESSGHKV